MSEKKPCWKHGTMIDVSGRGCVDCLAELASAPNVSGMTVEDRIVELERWVSNPMTARFDEMWPRLDALAGRSTYNHEWAQPEAIYAEMRGEREWEGPVGSMQRVVPHLPIIVVETEAGAPHD